MFQFPIAMPAVMASHGAAIAALGKTRFVLPRCIQAAAMSNVAEAAQTYAENVNRCRVNINGRTVDVPEGTSILNAARQLGVYIPTLCNHPKLPCTPGTCRLCMVEENGRLRPACATPVADGMTVATDTPAVHNSITGILKMMRSNHPKDCMTCDVSGRCEFQDLLGRYNIVDELPAPKLRHASHEWDDEVQFEGDQQIDAVPGAIHFDLDKCLKCGRCVSACGLIQDMNVLGMVGRGGHRHPAPQGPLLEASRCIECGQCSLVCPVGAVIERSEWREVMEQLDSRRKCMIAMTAPSVRVAIGEEVGLGPGSIATGQMVAALRRLGFDKVIDVDFAADLTIMEEGTELLARLAAAWGLNDGKAADANEHAHGEDPGPLPMFTSCCPGWVTMVEKSWPELIPYLSTCKSPQGMMGAIVKRMMAKKLGKDPADVCLVSVMPCTAKKSEAIRAELKRPDEAQDVDYVLTTRELGHMLRERRVPLASLPEEKFDSPMGESSGAAVLFGATGGVMEAALRTAYEVSTGKPLPRLNMEEIRGLAGVKEATIKLPEDAPPAMAGREIRVAVASGIGNARHLLQEMSEGKRPQYHFIEVMACPGGCIGGGGQPKTQDPDAVLKRMGAVYSLDERSAIRKSHENTEVKALYEELLGHPGSEVAHELLHTTYHDRSQSGALLHEGGTPVPVPTPA